MFTNLVKEKTNQMVEKVVTYLDEEGQDVTFTIYVDDDTSKRIDELIEHIEFLEDAYDYYRDLWLSHLSQFSSQN